MDSRFVEDFGRLALDAETVRFTRVPERRRSDFADRWIGRYAKGWAAGKRAGFAVLSREGEFLGMAGIVALDLAAREGEIGYIVAPAARGRGVAVRALRLVTGWALDALGLQRVELWIDVDNQPSISVAERAGYRREGVLRSVHVKDDVRSDQAVYSFLPADPRR